LNLKQRNAMDVHRYVENLEQWLIDTLKEFGVEGFTREGRVGVWVNTPSPACGGGLGGGDFVHYGKVGEELRKNPTDAEKRLWYFLQKNQLGYSFRRQHAIG